MSRAAPLNHAEPADIRGREAHSRSDTAPTEQEPAPPPAKKPKVAKPPEPPWKTFEAASCRAAEAERKAPATFVAGPASGKRVDLDEGPGAQTRGDKAPQEEKANAELAVDKAAVGERVEVYWDGNDKWFKGEVKDYAPTTQKHLVKYEDNDTQWLILAQEEQLRPLRRVGGSRRGAAARRSIPEEAAGEEVECVFYGAVVEVRVRVCQPGHDEPRPPHASASCARRRGPASARRTSSHMKPKYKALSSSLMMCCSKFGAILAIVVSVDLAQPYRTD